MSLRKKYDYNNIKQYKMLKRIEDDNKKAKNTIMNNIKRKKIKNAK